MWNVNDKGHDADTERVVVRVHDVAAGGARARAQDGGAEADAMTVRVRAGRGRRRRATPRVTPRRRRSAGAHRRRHPHHVRAHSLTPPVLILDSFSVYRYSHLRRKQKHAKHIIKKNNNVNKKSVVCEVGIRTIILRDRS